MLPYRSKPARVALAAAAAFVLVLPGLQAPEAGIGRDLWVDPGEGPFRSNATSFFALFVLNLNDIRCPGAPLGTADLVIAERLADAFAAQGVPRSQLTILVDKGSGSYGAATEANVRGWITATAAQANAVSDSRVFVMMTGHGLPYLGPYGASGWRISRPVGASICLNGGQEMLDSELAAYLSAFESHVQIALAASCSLCGGFADKYLGPVNAYSAPTVTGGNRVVAVGCGTFTECTAHPSGYSFFHKLWSDGVLTGNADGWTYVHRDDAQIPYDSRMRDGRVTFEEAYWFALGASATDGVVPPDKPGAAFAQRFVLADQLAGGFLLTRGGPGSIASNGTGGCTADLRDYDGDGVPNALDVVNHAGESSVSVSSGSYVRTASPVSFTGRLVVTSPMGRTLTYAGATSNVSLDAFLGEPVDGTWTFDQRASGTANQVLEVRLNGKLLSNSHPHVWHDAGALVWNWHADSRTDDSVLLDVDPCPATGLRFYAASLPGGTPP